MEYAIAVAVGYALGCIPFPYLLGRLRGVDLYQVGTGNPGAANLFRQVSRPLGVLGGVLDVAKGALAVLAGRWLGLPEAALILPGAAVVAGQWHPAILRFKGGEGLATGSGVGLGALPVAAAAGFAVGLSAIAALRNTGYGAGVGWAAFLAVAFVRGDTPSLVLGLFGLGTAIFARSLLKGIWARRRLR